MGDESEAKHGSDQSRERNREQLERVEEVVELYFDALTHTSRDTMRLVVCAADNLNQINDSTGYQFVCHALSAIEEREISQSDTLFRLIKSPPTTISDLRDLLNL
jgi:ferritin-like metal-binding protein YciE